MEKAENKMGTEPITKLLITMSIPMILSMLVQALYNTVDSIFLARFSEASLTAVSLAYPVQNLMIALGVGMGVGLNALVSMSLGERNKERALITAWNGFFLEAILYLLFLLFGMFGADWFMSMQGVSGDILAGGITYIRIICVLSFGFFLQMEFERITLAAGKTHFPMIIQLTGAVTNIILDPILIFGLLGFPKLGVAGAAYATVIGQITGGVLGIYLNQKRNPEVRLELKYFKINGDILLRIIRVGIPSTIMTGLVAILTFVMNAFLLTFSSTAVAFYGIYNKLYTFVQMPVTGVNNAVVPIFSYNYGAGQKDRMRQVVQSGCSIAFGLTLLAFLVFELAPSGLLAIFDASDAMLEFGVVGLRTIAFSFLFYGISIILTSVLQASGKALRAIAISLLRQIVILLPIAGYFTKIHRLNGIWLAFVAAEFVGMIVSLVFYRRFRKQVLR